MKIILEDAQSLGQVMRAVRKAQGVRQNDKAGSFGISEDFLGRAERAGETVQWSKLFRTLDSLGVNVELGLPNESPSVIVADDEKKNTCVLIASVNGREFGRL